MELDTVPQPQPHHLHHSSQQQQPHRSASDSRVAALHANAAPQRHPRGVGPSGRENGAGSSGRGEDEYEALKYGASHVILLFVPVSLCMAAVILTIASVGFYSENDGQYLPYTPFHSDTENAGVILLQSIGNALIVLALVIVATIVLVLLYYYRFYKLIRGWLIVSTLALLTMFTASYILELFKNYNIPLDYLTLSFFLWNWSMVGMLCIHWKGPLLLQQFYLIAVSALMALLFIKYLPDWSVWTVLTILSIWDLVAVLCPKGPLRILVETTQERNEPILPALIYSSTILYPYVVVHAAVVALMANGTAPKGQEEGAETEATAAAVPAVHVGDGTADDEDDEDDGESEQQAQPQQGPPNDTLLTTVLLTSATANPSGTESRTQTTSTVLTASSTATLPPAAPGGAGSRRTGDSTQPRTGVIVRTRSPRHPASERAVPAASHNNNDTHETTEERGVKLGLGDFIFYSVLVGKASSYGDWNVTIACYVAILVGLAFTLMLLALFRKALPALPISIFTGILFFFGTRLLISPFLAQVSIQQILL